MSRIRSPFVWVAAVVVLCAGGARGAEPMEVQEAREVFESLFGADLGKVAATRDTRDDVELGAKLLETARTTPNHPELIALLCVKAFELGSTHRMGYETAAEAMDYLSAQQPEKAPACQEQVLPIRQRLYDTTRGRDRTEAGQALLASLETVADAKTRGRDFVEAGSLYRRAIYLARSIQSDRQGPIEEKARHLVRLRHVQQQIEMLQGRLEADPSNAVARDGIVRLCLVDMNDPKAAAGFLNDASGEELRRYVPAAAKPLDEVPELALLELGDWYRKLGESAEKQARVSMLLRAREYYEHFLAVHEEQDLRHTQATLALEQVDEELKELGAGPGGGSKDGPIIGRTLDLLALIDPTKDTASGTWEFQGTRLHAGGTGAAKLTVPLLPKGDYELQAKFVRMAPTDEVNLNLPVGDSAVLVRLGASVGRGADIVSGLALVNGRDADANVTTVKPARFVQGTPYTVDVKVIVRADQAQVTIELNGRPYITWAGPWSALTVPPDWALPESGTLGLGAVGKDVIFGGATLKMLSGKVWASREPTRAIPGLAMRPPIEPTHTAKPGGARMGLATAYYKLETTATAADLPSIQPYAQDVVQQLYFPYARSALPQSERRGWVGAMFVGYLEVKAAGEHVFHMSAEDGAIIYLGQDKLIEGSTDRSREISRKVTLKEGFYAIRAQYYQGHPYGQFILRWEGPGIDKQVIPVGAFWYVPGTR